MENQNSENQAPQTINIQIPSLDNLGNRRGLIPSAFAISIIFFFFTFCDFKCGGQKIASVTGYELVTGTNLSSNNRRHESNNDEEKIPSNIWAVLAFGCSVLGCVVFLIKEKREAIVGALSGFVGIGSLIILQIVIKNSIEKKGEGNLDVSFEFPYWGAMIAMGIAAILSYKRFAKTHNIIVSYSQPSSISNDGTSESDQPYKAENPNMQASNFDIWGRLIKIGKGVLNWANNNKKSVLILAISTMLLIVIYFLFLKNYPERDGQKSALSKCDCAKEQYDRKKTLYKKFISEFDSYKFSGRPEANQRFQSLNDSEERVSQLCFKENQEKYAKLRYKYQTNEEQYTKFDNAFNSQQNRCKSDNTELNNLYYEVTIKINNFIGQVELEEARKDSIENSKAMMEVVKIGMEVYGGIVVFEENGHGIVVASKNFQRKMTWNNAYRACNDLSYNGYDDWRLPTKEELNLIYQNLRSKGKGVFYSDDYWSSTEDGSGGAWMTYLDMNYLNAEPKTNPRGVCAVREFRTND